MGMHISYRTSFLIVASFIVVFWTKIAIPAPVNPEPYDTRHHVDRVAVRTERIDIIFPEAENWNEVERDGSGKVEVHSFEADQELDDLPFEFASVTVFHDIWDADIDEALKIFHKRISIDCENINKEIWFSDDGELKRRIVMYQCVDAGGEYSAMQLLLQGIDNFYAIELYNESGLVEHGKLVRWTEFLKNIKPCFLDRDPHCPNGIWTREPKTGN
jgi:hypothetical protein